MSVTAKSLTAKVVAPPLPVIVPEKKAAAAPLVASPELLEELAEYSRRLEGATPREIIAWAVEKYFPKLTMATAFGPEGCVILHFLAEVQPKVYVFNLDTGYQFKETLELRDRIAKRYGIEVELRSAETTIEQYEAQHGGPVYKTNPDQCCFDRKVTVLRKAVVGLERLDERHSSRPEH